LFIPKSKTIATIGMDENSPNYLKLWDYSNANKITFLKNSNIAKFGRASSMATNQTKYLFAVSEDSDLLDAQPYDLIDIYNIKTRKSIKRLKFNVDNKENLSSHEKIAFSPDGKFLIFSAFTSRIWNTQDWKLIATVDASRYSENKKQAEIIDYVISSDSKWVATLTNTSEVRLWDIKSGQLLPNDQQPFGIISNEHKFDPNTYNDSKIQVSSNGKFLYIIINFVYPHEAIYDIKKYKGVGVAFYKWDLTNHKLSSINLVKNFTFDAVAFSPDGKYFVMAGYNKSSEVSLWDLPSFFRIQTLVTGEGSYYDVDVSSDGDIAAAQDDGELLLWQRKQ
jgi:WD40 repeat protein